MERSILPEITTSLNALSGVCLLVGLYYISRRNITGHMRAMWTAFAFSTLFLLVYLLRVWLEGTHTFPGTGTVRTVYLTVLATHTVLAMILVPLALITLYRAYRKDYRRHARIARWTVPIWLYVSATGPVIYFMLYHLPH